MLLINKLFSYECYEKQIVSLKFLYVSFNGFTQIAMVKYMNNSLMTNGLMEYIHF